MYIYGRIIVIVMLVGGVACGQNFCVATQIHSADTGFNIAKGEGTGGGSRGSVWG